MPLPPDFLETLARSIKARGDDERLRRASMRLPEATTADGTVFHYIPLGPDQQAQGCSDDWVFGCSCRHVWVILIGAKDLTEDARAERLRALGWELPEGAALWRCPDCVAVWAIVKQSEV
jgi:hypothetical protein